MVALPLFDVVISSESADRAIRVASRLASSALIERSEIQKLDDSLAPDDPIQFDRQTTALIRGMYEQWVHEAEALLDRIADVERRFGPVPGVEQLRHAHGKTMAMLSISLDAMEAGSRDLAEGRVHTLEEVRRELGLRVR
jgi:hypothetical protein